MAIERAQLPLGREESDVLEVKSRASLEGPSDIARAVVAFLNAGKDAEVWIGLREDGGRAVEVEPIAKPKLQRDQLWNHLVDTIDPSPTGEEVELTVVDTGASGAVLRAEVRPRAERKPYARVSRGARYFHVRVGNRTREMTREEIGASYRGAPQSSTSGADLVDLERELLKERKTWFEAKDSAFRLVIQPASDLDIDLNDPQWLELLRDARRSGNRSDGWAFADWYQMPQPAAGMLRASRVDLHRSGKIVCSMPLAWFEWPEDRQRRCHVGDTKAHEINPVALCELTVSVVRLARTVYGLQRTARSTEDRGRSMVFADLALRNTRGWHLRPYSPDAIGYRSPGDILRTIDDFALDKPLRFTIDEVVDNPDRCAYRLLERVYEAFGHARMKMPREFDPDTGRFKFGAPPPA